MRTLYAELKKARRRHNLFVAVSISLFVLLWATQTGGTGEGRLEQGYWGLFYAVPVMNTVVMPLGTAVLASRLWDLESKGNSCRMLLTLQSRKALFLGKTVVAANSADWHHRRRGHSGAGKAFWVYRAARLGAILVAGNQYLCREYHAVFPLAVSQHPL